MSATDTVTVAVDDLRRLFHEINNVAATVLTKSELALRTDDPAERELALERIGEIAEALGDTVRAARRAFLEDDGGGSSATDRASA